jgi:hypothetical protein
MKKLETDPGLSGSIIIFMMGLVSEQISQMRYDRVED